jgi:hypothetical protein
MEEDDSELETAFKVVAIMQTISEDLDESAKRMWRKMLGISTEPRISSKKRTRKQPKQTITDTE